jgi:hypothetical protein
VVPLGLLSYIAEKNIPLIGFSSTAAATEPVRTVERTELYGLLRGALSLALDVGAGRLSV